MDKACKKMLYGTFKVEKEIFFNQVKNGHLHEYICLYQNKERPLVQQTLIAVSIKEISSVREAGAVGVVVNSSYSWFIPSAVTPGQVDGVTHTAIGQPAGVTAV